MTTAKGNQKAYDRNAQAYAEQFSDLKQYRDKITLFQRTCLKPGDHILDVGCGPGITAGILLGLDSSYHITGVDFSDEMLNIARRDVPGADFRLGDIRKLQIGQTYDAIIASFCMVHLTDEHIPAFLRSVSALMRDDAVLYLSFMEGEKSGLEKTRFSDDEIFFNYFQQDAVIDLLSECGIDVIEVLHDGYEEQDGSITNEVFVFGGKAV